MRLRFSAVLLFFVVLITGLFVLTNTLYEEFPLELDHSKEEGLKLRSKQVKKELQARLSGDLYSYIHEPVTEIEKTFGEPHRKDATPFGYTWYVYKIANDHYVQFGIQDEKVVMIFGTGDALSIEPLEIGMSYETAQAHFPFEEKVTYVKGVSFYTFILNDEDLDSQPLVPLSPDVFVQLYFDTFTDTLSSIRIATGDVLIQQRFYEMEYRGTLPEQVDLSDEAWEQIEKGKEQQILTLTNLYRNRYDASSIELDTSVSVVAKLHSKDMYENSYFSHESQDGRGLKERLDEQNIFFLSAGENIAAQYTDAPAVVEGWLNSEGHREALLEKTYTHIGIGVYRDYYTQNFITKHE